MDDGTLRLVDTAVVEAAPLGEKIFVVIPAYNEAKTIADLVRRVQHHVAHVVVVDDGSADDTAQLLAGTGAGVVRHAVNRGKAASLMSGFRKALAEGATAIVSLDGDGQHRPDDIPRFLAAMRAHPGDLIIGSRLADRAAFPPSRYRANRIANFWLSWASGYPIEDSQCGFRVYPRAALEKISVPTDGRGFVFESEFLIAAAHAGVRARFVPIPALYDRAPPRASHFRPVADIAGIVFMVAGKLLRRGMYPAGLIRLLRGR
ncbi:MAG: glycosyltransferase family 2 protein [Alphaproteobacteria bacterium]